MEEKDLVEVSKNIFLVDLGVYLRKFRVLIIADLHIGLEEALNKEGVLIPRFQLEDLINRMRILLELLKSKGFEVERVIINGDLKHEFGTISSQEWKDTLKFLSFLEEEVGEVVIVKGNHDTILGPIASKKNVKVVDYLVFDDILIIHGHKVLNVAYDKNIKIIIIAHEHPAVGISDGLRTELFKAFLFGSWHRKKLIVMPSFCLVNEGSNILREETLSPFLKETSINKFKVFVVGDKKLLYFGSVENLLRSND